LAIELDPQHTRALEVVALARVESARAHERHTILSDLSRAGKQQRRHRASAEVREHHARDVVRGRGREGVEVAVRVEVDERELRLGSERTRQSARDERALSADDERERALAQRDEDTVRKRPAGLARGAQPAIARIEWDAHALLGAKAFGEERSQRRGGFRSEEHTSELQSPYELVCRILLEKKNEILAPERSGPKRLSNLRVN